MRYDAERHHRRSLRLKGYDYSQAGAYFVTICTQNRACLFGDVTDGQMRPNDAGRFADQCWLAIPDHHPQVLLDEYVIMPNHVHAIIVIVDRPREGENGGVGAKHVSPLPEHVPPLPGSAGPNGFRSPARTIGSVIRGFKIGVTKWFRQDCDLFDVWQRNYHDHIIRDEESLNRIRGYIMDNPANWDTDTMRANDDSPLRHDRTGR